MKLHEFYMLLNPTDLGYGIFFFCNVQRLILGTKGLYGKVKLVVNHATKIIFLLSPAYIGSKLDSVKGHFDLVESNVIWENIFLIN